VADPLARVVLVASVLLCTVLPSASIVLAGTPTELLPPTPMVLKDGRIARVSAFAVPIPPGEVKPDGPGAADLVDFVDGLASDCFLTAQVIGHAEPGFGGNDPLAPHRLARARADAIRDVLLARGLPEASVTSVWDWQLGLRDSRATLWVFQLLKGEDCDGNMLPRPEGWLLAAMPLMPAWAGPMTAVSSAIGDEPPLMPPLAGPMIGAAITVHATAKIASTTEVPKAEASPATPAVTRQAVPTERTSPPVASRTTPPALAVAAPAQPKAPIPPSVAAVTVDAGSKAKTRPDELALAAPEPIDPPLRPRAPVPVAAVAAKTEPTGAVVGAARAAAQLPLAPTVVSDADGLSITFDADSSYLPTNAGRELRRLAAGFAADKSYEVSIEGTVAPDAAGATAPDGQRAYGRWVAERRLARIEELVRQNSNARGLDVHQSFVPNDASRRVTVRVHPAP
jgi:outer membrane protein OmpA-like peptidoglycan-associated protein